MGRSHHLGSLVTPLPVVLGDKPHVSVSTIESYLYCPRRTWREKFAPPDLRIPFRTGPELVVGSAAHTPVEYVLQRRIDARRLGMPDDWARLTSNVERWYDAAFTKREKDVEDWKKLGRHETYLSGLHACAALVDAAEPLDVVAVERSFSLPLWGIWTVDGRIDGELADLALVDFKTEAAKPSTAWKWSQEKADTSLQAGVYAAVTLHETGMLPPYFLFIVARKKAGSVAKVYRTVPTRPRIAMAMTIARFVALFIERGNFPKPRSGCWGCPLNGEC